MIGPASLIRLHARTAFTLCLLLAGGNASVATEPAGGAASMPLAAQPAIVAPAAAAPAVTVPAPPAPRAIAPAPPGIAHPWHTLTPRQQEILLPLRPEWNRLTDTNRSKWLRIAQRYPKLSKDQQQRLQERMRDWIALTPQQRRTARENFQISKQLPADKKAEAWQDYQQLTDAQKKKLAAEGRARKPATAVSALPSGGGIVTNVRPPHQSASQVLDIDELLHGD